MIGSQAVIEVQQIVGWRSDKAAEILLALQQSQTQREKPGMTFPWWLRKYSGWTTVAGTRVYSLPADFIQEAEPFQNCLYISLPNKLKHYLRRVNYQTVEQAIWTHSSGQDWLGVAQETGLPTEYVLDWSGIYMYPTPDAAYQAVYNYWIKDDVITLGSENRWLREAPWVLIGDAASKIGALLENSHAVAVAQAILAQAKADMFRSAIVFEETGRVRHMGSRL